MRTSLIPILVLMLAGCATPPARAPVDDPAAAWERRQQRLAHIDAWDLHGRLAVSTADEAGNASFHWVRRRERNRLTFAAPFGGGRMRLDYDGEHATLTDRRGEVHHGASIQELLARATGWWLPVQGLEHWMLGLPAPSVPAQRKLDRWGRLSTLLQGGWRIEYVEYVEQDGYELPRRIFLRRQHDGVFEALEARFVIERWSVRDTVAARRVP